jgi:acyl transferase domain-containing protein
MEIENSRLCIPEKPTPLAQKGSNIGVSSFGFGGTNAHAIIASSRSAPPKKTEDRKVAFLFTGQGSHQAGKGKKLYQVDSVFRDAIDRCAEAGKDLLPEDLRDILFDDSEAMCQKLESALYSQASIFCTEYALAEMWLARGVRPHAVMGHSVGEWAAAVIAGSISLEDGLKMVTSRGKLIDEKCPRGVGVMVVCLHPEQRWKQL